MPVAIPAIIAAAGTVGGAAIASHAAGSAADKQTAAANQATQLQRDIYNQQRTDQMPWLNTGRGAVSTLGRLMGIDSNPAPVSALTSAPQIQAHTPSPNATYTGQFAVNRTTGVPAQSQPMPLSSVLPGNVSSYAGGMVRMRAPNGFVGPVAASDVAHYEALGATRV